MRWIHVAFIGVAALVAAALVAASALTFGPAPQPDFHAIVERDGSVVLCMTKGEILFADRCAGAGMLSIVQPLAEGEVIWRSVLGKVVMENEAPGNPDCALARAKWDQSAERAVSSGRRITRPDPTRIVTHLKSPKAGLDNPDLSAADVTVFEFDLNGDGVDEIIFSADNVPRIVEMHERTKESYPFVVAGGIDLHMIYLERGQYEGGTDAIGHVELKGIVPIAAKKGETALLVKTSPGYDGDQKLIRYREGGTQTIETILFVCN